MTSSDPNLAAGQRLVAQLTAGTPVVPEVRLNRVDVTATDVQVDDALLDDLFDARKHGHSVRVSFNRDAWTLTINADPESSIVLDQSGEPADVLSGQVYTDFEAAVARNDALSASRIAAAATTADIHVTVRNNPEVTGHHWIRSGHELANLLTNPQWVTTTNALTSGPSTVLVDDAADGHVKTELLDFVGPATAPTPTSVTGPRVLSTGPGNHDPNLASPRLTGRPRTMGILVGSLAGAICGGVPKCRTGSPRRIFQKSLCGRELIR